MVDRSPMTTMRVAEIWRYPVKSLAGERLDEATLTEDGIPGDRMVLVVNGQGHVVTSRTRPALLGLRGTLGEDGEPLVNGRPWTDPEVAELIRTAAGPDARLVRYDGPERFDVLPLLVATDGAVAHMGFDRRRLRPNILIEGVEGLAERGWPGRTIHVGEAVIGFVQLRGRCVMTTYDPDTQVQDPSVLRRIVRELGGKMALDSSVVRGGVIRVSDPVELV